MALALSASPGQQTDLLARIFADLKGAKFVT
jgi:hypothetical protein